MKRKCVPSPNSKSPQWASILNSIFLPSTRVTMAVAVMVSPILLGLRWDEAMCPPTVVQPSGRWSATASMAAFSMSAIIAGVASTAMSPEPIAMAVTSWVTVNSLVCRNPSCNMIF